ncbi:1,2-phenylacetyl-CoA epoxidase subunit PaaE [Nocardioides lianchengensis]|uniref:Ring-1,2-phenylacetyl-CoA epoxidase subunit PaaE n=1 Tax=Nocardioides lianchengensis TaxID=1045774 RepID=A0A1G6PPE0_9ACTN|nr:1,2-phenylacetyl-CoA epoxidase subunit PaaE [Nocardioides lianchengensis]NYG11924.1 ring-1,2-phenylacetyl-CoA epoxidase subunit PaaE [Nocardioides lianchengensis]SDC81831.1 ring-1,2-phenylacetyl-CoA epoxidase subunit PaaE [Nocardioides lianchengensis]
MPLLEVARVDRLTDDAVAVTFAVPDDLAEAFAFEAGQSLTLRRVVDGVEHRRSYSICAPVGAPPRIGVREIPDGLFSRWLVRDVTPGATVEVLPPTGRWRVEPGGRHLCIGAGSGITPLLSIAATALSGDGEVTLLYGNRTSGSVMFAEELADLKDRHGPRLSVVHVLSREPRDVDLFSGRLDADRLRRLLTTVAPLDGVDHVWVCGPYALVVEARAVLADLGVPPERVHVELFHVDEPPPAVVRAEAAPTGETSEVTAVLDGRAVTTRVARESSVLDGLQAVRADLPFACKGGVCGTCRALVREGEVDLRRNYALEPDEVDAGYVLTCQSAPVSDRVVVDFDA